MTPAHAASVEAVEDALMHLVKRYWKVAAGIATILTLANGVIAQRVYGKVNTVQHEAHAADSLTNARIGRVEGTIRDWDAVMNATAIDYCLHRSDEVIARSHLRCDEILQGLPPARNTTPNKPGPRR